MSEKFYITTTLPYVNSDPHLGFALEMVQADIIARYQKSLGKDVFFNTGTDEHGQKVYVKGKESGKHIQAYVNEYADKFRQLMPALGVSSDLHFIRTTEPHHIKAAQEFWKLCGKNGDIYKKNYKIKYCVGCELEKTESDLDDSGRCLIHPHLEIEFIDEENYFFKFSKYQEPLLKFYGQRPDFVVPDFRFNEIKQFVKSGLQDFSISRLAKKMPWGVPVPGDEAHVMYVWFDALINYVSTLGWPSGSSPSPSGRGSGEGSLFEQFWGSKGHENAIQIAGKDNLRQQSAMWQAMLMSAGLPNSKQIIIHGFINSGGQKMSKSLGNVADPYEILDKLQSKGLTKQQATDALRYYLAREISTFEDGDYTWEKFVESYNSGLANGLGNLTSRILKMMVTNGVGKKYYGFIKSSENTGQTYTELLQQFKIKDTTDLIWVEIQACDRIIQKEEPFKKVKTHPEDAKLIVGQLISRLSRIAELLLPILPQTSEKILAVLKDPKPENIPKLFPRIE